MASRSGEENARYMREYRLKVSGGTPLTVKGDGRWPDLKTHKSVESLVLAELHQIPDVGRHPALAAAMLALGRLLDDSSQQRVHPAAVNQLRAGLAELWAAGESVPAGRLQVLREKARAGA